MAVIVKWLGGPDNYVNADAVSNVVRYIYRGAIQLPKRKQIYGGIGLVHASDPEAVIREVMETKEDYYLADGVQCKHLVVSLGQEPNLPRKKIIHNIEKMLKPFSKSYQVFYGVHDEINSSGEENYHIHVMLNSVDMIRERKLNISNSERDRFKKRATRVWSKL